MKQADVQITEYKEAKAEDWVGFPGGELEGRRPKVLCPDSRAALRAAANGGRSQAPATSNQAPATSNQAPATRNLPLCFQCYRADVERERALKAAGDLDTASETRFQTQLPFEPVNRSRLQMLKADRTTTQTMARQGSSRFEHTRRQAQLAARHALQRL